jgi:hypothetical protein
MPALTPSSFFIVDMTLPPSDERCCLTGKTPGGALRNGVRLNAGAIRRGFLNGC